MQNLKSKVFMLPYLDCLFYPHLSDEQLDCIMQQFTIAVYHKIGTCKMGPKNDYLAVVDPELLVHGVNGVRVIDGSIMPTTISGHTNAPIIMIAEKGSDMIKNYWTKGNNKRGKCLKK